MYKCVCAFVYRSDICSVMSNHWSEYRHSKCKGWIVLFACNLSNVTLTPSHFVTKDRDICTCGTRGTGSKQNTESEMRWRGEKSIAVPTGNTANASQQMKMNALNLSAAKSTPSHSHADT